MTIRQDTRRFAAPCFTGNIADATFTSLDQFTITIPETVEAFRSVFLEVGYQDAITASGGTVTEHRVALRLGEADYTTFTETDDITQSGENMAAVIGPIDFTSHFDANWSGESLMTCDVQVYFDYGTGTTQITRNVTAVLVVTFDYDDDPAVNATQSKTVMIPLESLVGALPTAANSNFGSNQIPQLTGAGSPMLPEPSITIDDYFFLIEGNDAVTTDTDWTLSCNIDSGTALTFGTQEAALASSRFCRWIYKPSAVPDPTTAHQFQLWASQARANHVTVTLVVTYRFDATSLTRWLCSIMLPVEIASPLGVNTTAKASRFQREVFIQDPGTISLRQSGFRINFITTASIAGLAFRSGGQAYRGYTNVATAVCGMFSLQQRIDAGAAQGAGITLTRGTNTITIDGYATDTTDQATNINGYVLLNYECDAAAAGRGQHTHTVTHRLASWNAQLLDRVRVEGFTPSFPETDYWLTGIAFQLYQVIAAISNAITFDVQCLPGEGKGGGYYDIYADAYQADSERGCSLTWARGRDVFKRFPLDPEADRVDVEVARSYRFYSSTTTALGITLILTYHSFTYTVAGTVSGYTGDGSGIEIEVYRTDNNELVANTTTTVGGDFSLTYYDNTIPLFVAARQDATHVGRSDNAVAV